MKRPGLRMALRLHLVLIGLTAASASSAFAGKLRGAPADAETAKELNGLLQAENQALRKKVIHLEAVMHAVESGKKDPAEVAKQKEMEQNMGDLQKRLTESETDKKALMGSLRKLLQKNSTLVFQKQVAASKNMKLELESRCAQEQKYLNDQLAQQQKSAEAQLREESAKSADAKEMVSTLQEQNLDLQRTVRSLREEVAQAVQKRDELQADKEQLLQTVHSFMKDNGRLQEALKKAQSVTNTTAQELAVDEKIIAKLAPKPKTVAKRPPARKDAKAQHKAVHKEVDDTQKMARMRAINQYIERTQDAAAVGEVDLTAEAEDEESQSSPAEAKKEAEIAAEAKSLSPLEAQLVHEHTLLTDPSKEQQQVVSAKTPMLAANEGPGLRQWLGLQPGAGATPQVATPQVAVPKTAEGLSPIDALDPEAVAKAKAAKAAALGKVAQKTKKPQPEDTDEGGDGIEALLTQAKQQLTAMEDAEKLSSGAAA